jgi:hypothetical protein
MHGPFGRHPDLVSVGPEPLRSRTHHVIPICTSAAGSRPRPYGPIPVPPMSTIGAIHATTTGPPWQRCGGAANPGRRRRTGRAEVGLGRAGPGDGSARAAGLVAGLADGGRRAAGSRWRDGRVTAGLKALVLDWQAWDVLCTVLWCQAEFSLVRRHQQGVGG